MRLFETIVDANHRAVAGDASAGLHPADYADALPVVALTCIDPRLNAFFPNVLALPADQFIWLRNAGNVITEPMGDTARSLALACAVKGGREIAVIGHTDCHIAQTPATVLLDRFKALGVERGRLPDNLGEFFGTFGGERQNVVKACEVARRSPLIGPKIPIHGLLLDIETGKLDWIVNGYERLVSPVEIPSLKTELQAWDKIGVFKDFHFGELKYPDLKIGESAQNIGEVKVENPSAAQSLGQVSQRMQAEPATPPKIPLPPPLRPRINVQKFSGKPSS